MKASLAKSIVVLAAVAVIVTVVGVLKSDSAMAMAAIGKCCTELGDCAEVTAEECVDLCGGFGGPGTTCSGLPLDCPIPPIAVTACCLPDDSCTVTTLCQCGNLGGTESGAADCEDAACGTGRCCLEDGSCVDAGELACSGLCGTFGGAGTACTGGPLDCPMPPIVVSACCLPDESCTVVTDCECGLAGGTSAGVADCADADCGGSCGNKNDPCTTDGDCCSGVCKRNGRCR